jgi:Skp family chaperone for outer membrane proteins
MLRRMLTTLALAAVAGSTAGAAGLNVAVLDFHRAFREYERRDELQRELDVRKKQMNEDLGKLEEGLKARQSDLELLQPGSEKYRELQLKLIEVQALIEVTKRSFEVELEKTRNVHMQRLLAELEKELQAYAQEKGLDLVLAKYALDPRMTSPIFITLFSKPELDITPAIIERLNRKGEK